MKKTFIVLCLGLTCVSTFTACKKSTTSSTPSNSAPSVSTPSSADGALAAVVVKTTQTVAGYTVPINIGTAAAWFGSQNSYKDAGNVNVDANGLSKSNNAYIYQPSQTNPTGLSFNNSVAWDVTGNSGNGITAFNFSDNSSFPDVDDISNSGTVSSSGAFTLSATSTPYGDSVIFVVSGSQNHVTFIAPGGTSSHTFTAAEMATVGASGNNTGLLQIAPYRVNHQTINGKSYYFVKETCVSKFVTIN
ncbi:MAG: hypothetical protein JWO03_3693 [Bacteroidetes bacterium]|nr:hypothetical protein [Bacteroidota bacterium]